MKDGETLANPPMGCKFASYREEPGAGKLHAGICEGGVGQPAFPTSTMRPGKLCEFGGESPLGPVSNRRSSEQKN